MENGKMIKWMAQHYSKTKWAKKKDFYLDKTLHKMSYNN